MAKRWSVILYSVVGVVLVVGIILAVLGGLGYLTPKSGGGIGFSGCAEGPVINSISASGGVLNVGIVTSSACLKAYGNKVTLFVDAIQVGDSPHGQTNIYVEQTFNIGSAGLSQQSIPLHNSAITPGLMFSGPVSIWYGGSSTSSSAKTTTNSTIYST